jgi:multidrug efflux system outer membrane protein
MEITMRNQFALAILAAAVLAACSTGPDYRRPQLDLPAGWDQSGQAGAGPATKTRADWWRVFNDAALDVLVDEALQHNRDLAAAAARVEEARATLTVTDADRWPTIYGTANTARTRITQRGATPVFAGVPVESSANRITLAASYEADFWGKYSRASEAARADLLRTEAARDAVRQGLIADVISGYYALVSLEGQEKAAQRTYATRDELAGLQAKRFNAGVASELEVHTTEAEREAARVQQVAITRARAVEDARLAVLLGRSPRDVWQKRLASVTPETAFAQSPPPAVPEGLPSDLLERRPDLREAEQRLIAANARIGVAKAAYFPSIMLTGFLGTESAALSNLFTGPAGIFQLAAALTQPIWGAGRVDAQVRAATARQKEALANYEKAVQSAFADVRVALAAHQAARETAEAQSRRSAALAQAYKLARLRYDNGVSSLLEVLDAERNLLAADLARLDALAAQRAAVADLIKALGGGWA